MSLAAGARLGPYRIEQPVGKGAFATVYRARDDRLDTSVAIKVLAENHALDPDIRGRFIDEARMIRRVASPRVVQVHEVGETPTGQPFLVLELAARGDLHQRLVERAGGPRVGIDLATAAPVLDFLVASLHDVHRAGLVHRDVKPQNILIAERPGTAGGFDGLLADDERFLLGDLGFAKDLEAASGLTSGGGTRWFQAPEQIPTLGQVDHRADIYAAAAVTAWLLTGSVPDPGGDWAGHLTGSGVHPRVTEVVMAGLAHDPADRPPSIQDWARPFAPVPMTPVATGATGTPATAGPPSATGAAKPVRRRGRSATAVAGVAVTAALLGGAAGFGASALVGGDADVPATVIDGNAATTSLATGAGTITVSGPSRLTVDQPALIVATTPPGVSAEWVEPDGNRLAADRPLEVTARSAGRVTVNLTASIDGRLVVVTHETEAIEES